MKNLVAAFFSGLLLWSAANATTITVVPIFEPLSLRGTDGDEAISDTGEALQACVLSRPMAMSGAFPEALVDAIRSPHLFPTNNPNYKIQETNLLVLCNILISGTMTPEGLTVRLDVSQLAIPVEVDLTARQLLRLTIVAVRKTLEQYQRQQTQPLAVALVIEGADETKAGLRELAARFTIDGSPREN
ncbi:MAG: hypothetical protein H8M99_05555 [Gloeobacteraceae cyanobacterium ES-bin-144]|nr:hypothetical protein [Verrucomicrobiales bacterium]